MNGESKSQNIDPLRFGYKEEFFIKRRLEESRETGKTRNEILMNNMTATTIADLVDSAYEIATSYEDRMDLEIKILSWKEFVDEKTEEWEKSTEKGRESESDIVKFRSNGINFKKAIDELTVELQIQNSQYESSESLLKSLTAQRSIWINEQTNTMAEIDNLITNEIIASAAYVYLTSLPHSFDARCP